MDHTLFMKYCEVELLNKVHVIVPVYNEERRVMNVLHSLIDLGFDSIIVIDDGSEDGTWDIINAIPNITKIQHHKNLGVGAATTTGIQIAMQLEKRPYIATIDGDGQHLPHDVINLLKYIDIRKGDFVIGSRFMFHNPIPWHRIIYNKIANIISYIFSNIYVTDSQSGMKVLSAEFAKKLILDTPGYEFCIHWIQQAHQQNVEILEHPIEVIYTKETLEKGQSFWTGVGMVVRLLKESHPLVKLRGSLASFL